MRPTRPRSEKSLSRPPWGRSPHRAELLALYAEADALLDGWQCACSTGGDPRCCRFGETGREPYPTAVELEEVRYAVRRTGRSPPFGEGRGASLDARRLPIVARGPCPLLLVDGRCGIYSARPLGCRTFFCRDADGPAGPRSKPPRAAIAAVARRMTELSARFDPHDPQPRPLVRALVMR